MLGGPNDVAVPCRAGMQLHTKHMQAFWGCSPAAGFPPSALHSMPLDTGDIPVEQTQWRNLRVWLIIPVWNHFDFSLSALCYYRSSWLGVGETEDIIRGAFITPAGNCFLRTHKKRNYCLLKCSTVLHVWATNAAKRVVPVPMRDPTGPLCPWGDKWGQIRAARAKKKKSHWEKFMGLQGKPLQSPECSALPSELLKPATCRVTQQRKRWKRKRESLFRSVIQPPVSLWWPVAKQIYVK